MPFPPLHMGPAIAVKAIAGRHFSLMLFGFSQVAMDIEPLVRIIRGDLVLHGYTHTYLGATLIAILSIFIGRPVCQRLLDYWRPAPHARLESWLRGPRLITWPAAISGAFVGTSSHVVLDSIMHSDMEPLAPLSASNRLLHVVSVESLHGFCLLTAALGAALVIALFLARGRLRAEESERA